MIIINLQNTNTHFPNALQATLTDTHFHGFADRGQHADFVACRSITAYMELEENAINSKTLQKEPAIEDFYLTLLTKSIKQYTKNP